jgi:hypothetical protein
MIARRIRMPFAALLLAGAFLVAAGSAAVPAAHAQRQIGAFGAGGQAGLPGGATLKLYRDDIVAYDLLLNTDLDDRFVVFVHRVWERPIPDSPLWIYAGPGIVAGAEDLTDTPDAVLGASALGGLNFYADRFEVFLQLMPRLQVRPDLAPRIGGSVGLRYYL